MKIIALQAENIKRLIAVEIRPDGNLVQITGRNGQGKTSILDSIWWALSGTASIQGEPIRKGQDSAWIRLDLGDIVVTRVFKALKGETGMTTSIVVENADGARFPSPQTMIDQLLGALSFDPLAFSRMDPRRQFETLRQFVPGVDFDALDTANKADYERRTWINRQIKQASAAAEAIQVDAGTPEREIDIGELIVSLEEAGKQNADVETRKANRQQYANLIKGKTVGLDQLENQAKNLRDQLEGVLAQIVRDQGEIAAMKKRLDDAEPLPDPVDTADLRQRIEDARLVNQAVQFAQKRKDHLQEQARLQREADALTEQMEARIKRKLTAISESKLPVEGIGFGDEFITLNGVPFNQASDAEQLRTSIAIAMAMNPKLRVIRVRDGSLLDEDSLKILADMADEQDYQVWLERVESSGKVGFVLEDGRVKSTQEVAV